MGRSNKGLKRTTLRPFVETAKSQSNEDKKLAGLLLPFTGIRSDVFCHLHGPTCFNYERNEDDDLVPRRGDDGTRIPKLKVHKSAPCRKGDDYKPCGDCRRGDREQFEAKYGHHEREIPLPSTWKDWSEGETHDDCVEKELGLPELVENYFKLDEDDYGKEMVAGDGVSQNQVRNWIKDIAEEAGIGYERGTVVEKKRGETVEIHTHDMRGTYCMVLIRNNYHRTKIISYTGHKHVSSLSPYEKRVAEETDDINYLDHI